MQNEKYLELDALAAPNGYVAPPMKEDLAYVVHFRKSRSGRTRLRDPYGRENIFTEACLIL